MAEHDWTRRELLRRGLLVTGALALPSGALSCARTDDAGAGSSGTLAKIKSQGYVTAGIAGEAPYAFMRDSKLTGLQPALTKAIWKQIGIEDIRPVRVDFGQLIPGLVAKRFDVVSAAMNILPERCAQVDFSEPTVLGIEAFMVPRGNPKKITDYDTLARTDATLGVLPGAVQGIYAKELGIPSRRVVELSTQRDAFAAVKSGRVDVVGLSHLSLNWVLKNDPDPDLEVTDGFVPVIKSEKKVSAGAEVFRKADEEIRQEFNTGLKKLRESGEWLEIIEPFGGTKEMIPSADLTAQELCEA